MLIAFAIIVGIVLLMFALNDPDTEIASADETEEVETADTEVNGEVTEADEGAADALATDNSAVAGTIDEVPAEPEVIPEETVADTPARAPSEVNVVVANGIGTAGIAGATADILIADGYIGVAADAPNGPESVIFYRETFDGDARAIAEILGATPDVIRPLPLDAPVPINQNAIDDGRAAAANVVVILGTDGAIPTP